MVNYASPPPPQSHHQIEVLLEALLLVFCFFLLFFFLVVSLVWFICLMAYQPLMGHSMMKLGSFVNACLNFDLR